MLLHQPLLKEKKTSQFVTQKKFWDSVHMMDYKFMLIPVFFILLRIWSCISDVMMFADIDVDNIPSGVTLALLILSVSTCTALAVLQKS